MEWKNYPIWLRGGIIAAIVGIIWFVLGLVFGNLGFCSIVGGKVNYCGVFAIFFIPSLLLAIFSLTGRGILIAVISTILIYFLIGAFIGWIVGKIKHKK